MPPGSQPAVFRDQLGGEEITAASVLRSLVAGLVCGVLAVVLSISKGVLLVADGLPDYAPYAIGMALFATVVIALIDGLTGQFPGTVAIVQDVPTVALAMVVGVAFTGMADRSDPEAVVATMVFIVGGATIVSGVVALLLSHFRLGSIARYVPYPVIGGFLAGTGWLIALGGFGLVIGEAVTLDMVLDSVARLSAPTVAGNAALAAATVILLTVVDRLSTGGLAVPVAVLAVIVVFNLGAWILGAAPDQLRDIGWLVRLPEGGTLWPAPPFAVLDRVDWAGVAAGAIALPTMIVLVILAMLLNASGVQIATRRDTDLERELKTVGIMNVVAGAGGGLPGFVSVSMTVLAHRLGAATRLVGPVVALLSLSALIAGPFVLASVPTFLLGAILIWVGGGLLVEWLLESRRRLSRFEYGIVLLIFAVTVVVGFKVAILVGIIAAAFVFVVIYGRLNTVRFALTGADYARRQDHGEAGGMRPGDDVMIFALEGFLFFGTADRVRSEIEARLAKAPDIAVLIVDFRRVPGADSSAVLGFERILQSATSRGMTLVLSGMSENVAAALARGGLVAGAPGLHIAPDLDRAERWATARDADKERDVIPVGQLLADRVGDASATVIETYLERRLVSAGAMLVAEGATSDDVYFVESGLASVEVASAAGPRLHVAGIGPGAIVGEVAFCAALPRSASVVVEREMVAWKLSRSALARMRSEAPDAAADLQSALARALARRLLNADRLLHFLAD